MVHPTNAERSVCRGHPASIITFRPPLVGGACPTCYWSDDVDGGEPHPREVVGDDVAPTSLNYYEGMGKVVVSVLVVVFHLGLTRRLVDGWGRGGGTRRAAQMRKCAECGKAGKRAILGKVAKRDFPWRAVPKAISSRRAEDKPCCSGKDGMCI